MSGYMIWQEAAQGLKKTKKIAQPNKGDIREVGMGAMWPARRSLHPLCGVMKAARQHVLPAFGPGTTALWTGQVVPARPAEAIHSRTERIAARRRTRISTTNSILFCCTTEVLFLLLYWLTFPLPFFLQYAVHHWRTECTCRETCINTHTQPTCTMEQRDKSPFSFYHHLAAITENCFFSQWAKHPKLSQRIKRH